MLVKKAKHPTPKGRELGCREKNLDYHKQDNDFRKASGGDYEPPRHLNGVGPPRGVPTFKAFLNFGNQLMHRLTAERVLMPGPDLSEKHSTKTLSYIIKDGDILTQI